MRSLSVLLAVLISLPFPFHLPAQAPAGQLNLVIVEGEGAINNIRQRTAREPIVQVEDENHRPVAGAAVVFALPSNGASGVFANGSQTLTTVTDAQGRAIARGLRPNNVQGQYQIRVTASQGGRTGNATITQSNAMIAGAAAGAAAGGISIKLIAILAAVGAAAAGGAAYAATRSSSNVATIAAPTTITAGGGTVGPPK